MIHELENGLGIYESSFVSPGGTRGVVGGPHPKFTETENNSQGLYVAGAVYYTETVSQLVQQWKLSNDVSLLSNKADFTDIADHSCCDNLVKDDTDFCDSDHDSWFCGLGRSYPDDDLNLGHSYPDDDIKNPQSMDQLGCCPHCVYAAKRAPKCVKQFDEIENSGTEVTYRCVEC